MTEPVIKAILTQRGCDKHGCGHYGAPRGNRKHRGVDFWAPPDSIILAPAPGKVVRVGYCYSTGVGGAEDIDPFKLVQIRHPGGQFARYLYVRPLVKPGTVIDEGDPIGEVQSLHRRLPKIRPHVHIDVFDGPDHRQANVIHPDNWFRLKENGSA